MKIEKRGKLLSLPLAVAIIAGMMHVCTFAAGVDDLYGESGFEPEEPEIQFTAKDANILKRVIAGEFEISKDSYLFDIYDINFDGYLNAKDINIMKHFIAGDTAS